jgi:hypothetical protein
MPTIRIDYPGWAHAIELKADAALAASLSVETRRHDSILSGCWRLRGAVVIGADTAKIFRRM